jgi:2,5-diketo-D-gluconate reductase B
MKHFELNGTSMPSLGFGTFELKGLVCREAVQVALRAGYRHLDTARMYDNERDVGAAVRQAGVPREELFLTTKVWFDDLSAEGVERQLTESLRELDTDYVDLTLIHWPNDAYPLERTLDALEKQRERGRTRLVGVSNFPPSLVERAREHVRVDCNQVEYHPLLDQSAVLGQAREHAMVLTAYSPLAQGKALGEPTVRKIASRYGREPSQIILRWLVQQDRVAAIPRSSHPEHIRRNLDVFDFSLSDADMRAVSALARGDRQVDPEWAPEWGS